MGKEDGTFKHLDFEAPVAIASELRDKCLEGVRVKNTSVTVFSNNKSVANIDEKQESYYYSKQRSVFVYLYGVVNCTDVFLCPV